MSGPGGSVNPSNNAFAGGSYIPAGRPTGVGGDFTSPLAAGGPPPNFGTPAAAFARNDRGSNIRIPYARVVPMHGKDQLVVDDPALAGTGRTTAYEYDGLEGGELAWVMSKQFKVQSDNVNSGASLAGDGAIVSALDFSGFAHNINRLEDELSRANVAAALAGQGLVTAATGPDGAYAPANQAFGGFGVDRMQRLAYTSWVESLFKYRVGRQAINLRAISLGGGAAGAPADPRDHRLALDSELDYYTKLYGGDGPLNGASLFAVPDLAYALQTTMPGKELQVAVPMMQGLFVMEQGPFLRSYGVDHDPVQIEVGLATDGSRTVARSGRRTLQVEVDRHLGSALAQKALLAELKRRGLFNWTPDGICLSKFHTGPNGEADAEFDSRSGQLFNVGVQGPCITKTWCGNPDMHVLPMDKVFMLVVADLSYELENAGNAQRHVNAVAAVTERMAAARFEPAFIDPNPVVANARQSPFRGVGIAGLAPAADEAAVEVARQAAETEYRTALLQAQQNAMTALAGDGSIANAGVFARYQAFRAAVREVEIERDETARVAKIEVAEAALEAMRTELSLDRRREVESSEFRQTSEELRRGGRGVKEATLMNFRLMRATSSYLANTSHFEAEGPGSAKSRCGLKIGYCHSGDGVNCPPLSGNAEYIVGGWCIGTVLDSAASRAVGHANQVRTAPASMAINVNVNVEWWDADKLYQHYMDVDRGIYGPNRNNDRQVPQKTTLQRTESGYKDRAGYKREIASRLGGAAATDEAARLASFQGVGTKEGRWIEPNPAGVNTDAGKTRTLADLAGTAQFGQGIDKRVWETAQPEVRVTQASRAHVAATP